MALCDGPSIAAQSWVTAPFGKGFGFRCTRLCPCAAPCASAPMSNCRRLSPFFTPPILAPSTCSPARFSRDIDFLGKEVADGHSQVTFRTGAALVESQTAGLVCNLLDAMVIAGNSE